jgi:hypothetical protein
VPGRTQEGLRRDPLSVEAGRSAASDVGAGLGSRVLPPVGRWRDGPQGVWVQATLAPPTLPGNVHRCESRSHRRSPEPRNHQIKIDLSSWPQYVVFPAHLTGKETSLEGRQDAEVARNADW